MRYLGIDYGAKKIGIAISDEEGTMAFPKGVFSNDKNFLETIKKICQEENIGTIVLGQSFNSSGNHNKIMEEITPFKKIIESDIKLPVHFQREDFTTMEARRYNNKHSADASAAAIILQRYLEKLTTRN